MSENTISRYVLFGPLQHGILQALISGSQHIRELEAFLPAFPVAQCLRLMKRDGIVIQRGIDFYEITEFGIETLRENGIFIYENWVAAVGWMKKFNRTKLLPWDLPQPQRERYVKRIIKAGLTRLIPIGSGRI
jgi:hypothetical protein